MDDRAPAGTKIWIAAGAMDMRRGLHGLSAQVQRTEIIQNMSKTDGARRKPARRLGLAKGDMTHKLAKYGFSIASSEED